MTTDNKKSEPMTTMKESKISRDDISNTVNHVPETHSEIISSDDATSSISAGITRSVLMTSKKVVLSQLTFVKLQLKKTAFSLIRRQSGSYPTDSYVPNVVVEEGPAGKPSPTVKPPNEIIGEFKLYRAPKLCE